MKRIYSKTGILKGVFNSDKRTLPRIYRIWKAMKQRCCDKNYDSYKRYGAVGITISDDWMLFKNFYEDMNELYKKHLKRFGEQETTLDRIDNTKGYSKENCRWATRKEQANNTSNNLKNRYVNVGLKKISLYDFSKKYKISQAAICNKFRDGWNANDIVKNIKQGNPNIKTREKIKQILPNIDNIKNLDSRLKKILQMRFGLLDDITHTLEEVGQEFGISRERVRQLEVRALKLIKK